LLTFLADSFYNIAFIFQNISIRFEGVVDDSVTVPDIMREYLTEVLPLMRYRCAEIDLPLSVLALERLSTMAQNPSCTIRSLRGAVDDAHLRVRDVLSLRLFLHIPQRHASYYSSPFAGWELVTERFSCAFDVEEAAKCLAVGRFSAAVFHLMRIVEVAVLELQCFLDKSDQKAHFG
jgi:hypothetical protein